MGRPAAELTLLAARAPADTAPRSARPAFLRTKGRYTRFDAPGAASLTGAGSINNRGVIVGLFRDAAGVDHGFRRDRSGRFTAFDLPGAVATQALGANNCGQVVGDYRTPDGRFHGFRWGTRPVRHHRQARRRRYQPPRHQRPRPDRGDHAGAHTRRPRGGSPRVPAGQGRQGTVHPIEVPGAPRTAAYGLNDAGAIVGVYENPNAQPAPQPSPQPSTPTPPPVMDAPGLRATG